MFKRWSLVMLFASFTLLLTSTSTAGYRIHGASDTADAEGTIQVENVSQINPLKIEFTRIFDLPLKYHYPIQAFLENNRNVIPSYDTFAVSAMEQLDDWAHLVLIPSHIIDSGWQIYLRNDDIIEIFAHQNDDGQITITLINEQNRPYLANTAPEELYDFSLPNATSETYLFPWRVNEKWRKLGGWHPTNAIDFAPVTGPWDVLSSEAGALTQVCNDGYQAMLRVNHGGVTTGYLHLSSGSIPSNSLNQQIPRGKVLGTLYNGNTIIPNSSTYCANLSGKQFWTPCGCGTGPHLHFETSNTDITIDGYNISSVANSASGTQYTSSNNPDSGGTPPTPTPVPTNTPVPQAQAKLFALANFGGAVVWSGGTGFSNGPNANSYSLQLPNGWSAKTWRGDGQTGEERCWSSSVANLQDHNNWHLAIQSIEVFNHNACPAPTPTPPSDYPVMMCTTDNATGECYRFPYGAIDLSGDPLNDRIRSIHSVTNGKSVMLFREGGFRGTAECYNGPRIPLPADPSWDLRGQVTGVQVFHSTSCPSNELVSVVMYKNPNFGDFHWGVGITADMFNMTEVPGRISFNDVAQSMRIPTGRSVIAYDNTSGSFGSSSAIS